MKNFKRFRSHIKSCHLKVDAWFGRYLFQQPPLVELSAIPHKAFTPGSFVDFQYSKKSHFTRFIPLPLHLQQTPATCDLKVYQDSLIYTFIRDNLSPGAKILEIGGGESRIISALKGNYEFWNLDKLEGEGYGPKDILSGCGYYLIKDYIGAFSSELQENYFDLVFSISTLEHLPDEKTLMEDVVNDIQRILKFGGYSLHCIDGLLFDRYFSVHDIVEIFRERGLLKHPPVSFRTLIEDKDIWVLSRYAFYTRWYPIVRQTLKKFGFPFSINVLWQNIGDG